MQSIVLVDYSLKAEIKSSTSTPVTCTGIYPHMLITITASSGQFVTREILTLISQKVVRELTLHIAYNYTKFDDSSFSNSRDI